MYKLCVNIISVASTLYTSMNADTGTKVLLSDVRDLEHKYVEIAVIVIPDCIISCYRAVSDLAKQWLLAIT